MITPTQRFLTTVTGMEKTSSTEGAGGEGVGTAAGGMMTATAEAMAAEMARVALRGDEAGS